MLLALLDFLVMDGDGEASMIWVSCLQTTGSVFPAAVCLFCLHASLAQCCWLMLGLMSPVAGNVCLECLQAAACCICTC